MGMWERMADGDAVRRAATNSMTCSAPSGPAGRDLDARAPAWAGLNRHDGSVDDLAARRCPQVLGAAVGKRRVVGQERRQHVAGAPTKVL